MGKVYDALDDQLSSFLRKQHVFFVATSPTGPEGLINLSPKGLDTFRILGEQRVVYLDLTGSGIETIAHLKQNGRITLMFCAFQGKPRIVRLYGRGRSWVPGDAEFNDLVALFPGYPGARAVIDIVVERIADSCGYAVPIMSFEGERDRLIAWAERKGEDGLASYQKLKNSTSLDGLPGLSP